MIKVLIVDDEYIMRQGLRYMINWEQEGYEIVGEATNGKDALKMTEELQPHIIISDIVMPLLDGVDFSDAVHKMYPKIQMIILSGYDKFEYVKRTLMNGVVDYILKPTLNPVELINVLKKAAARIPGYRLSDDDGTVSYERTMERYLLGHDQQMDVGMFRQIFPTDYFCIYAVNIHKENSARQDMSDILHKKMERYRQEQITIPNLMMLIREEQAVILFGHTQSQKELLKGQVQELNDQLVMLCENVFGVLSQPFTNIEQVNEIYQKDIVRNLDKGFYYEKEPLLKVEGMRGEEREIEKFDFFRFNRMLGARQYNEALELLHHYEEELLDRQADVYRMKNQMKNMIYTYLDFLTLPDHEKESRRYDFFHMIDGTAYDTQYRDAMTEILEQLQILSGQKPTFNDKRMDRMISYIAKNYREDLKLEDLATEFNFNYHYLSAYFNQQMKEGFSDYLNRIRIEKACEMLEENQLSIAEISGEVGYSEHSYFCRVFKKVTGKTPSVWRREKNYE